MKESKFYNEFRNKLTNHSFLRAKIRIEKIKNINKLNSIEKMLINLDYIEYIDNNYKIINFNIKDDILVVSTKNDNSLIYKLLDNNISLVSNIPNYNFYCKKFDFFPFYPRDNPNLPSLVSGNLDGSVLLWTLNLDKKYQNSLKINEHDGYCNDAIFHPLGNYVLSCGNDKLIKLTNIKNSKNIHNFIGHKNQINQMKIHPDHNLILSSDDYGNILFWDLRISKIINVINLDYNINDLIIHNNGFDIFYTAFNNVIYNYDLRRKFNYREIIDNKKKIKKLNMINNNLLTISLDNTLKVYNSKDLNKISEIDINEPLIASDTFKNNKILIGTSENKLISCSLI